MIVSVRRSFEKDSIKLPPALKKELYSVIQNLQSSETIIDFPNCKKLSGYKNVYRIRLGNYRIGFFYSNKEVELVRILHRKEVYRYFP